ncbi:UPF0668 protein C10orf76-like [Acipenser ruthenus]|uniref:UPF0668 protein C10orf76-like n=1 Tax=Acipenser ruthenus TaxID=7906 RepID=A0A662YTV3_ACIRT|nr:UPF0668 protein C10orf76-like [Acipenser ruthenus]
MAQVEKKAGLLRKSSASKKPLKEKVVLMYEEIFVREDPAKNNPRFWEELFLMKVNLEYLEGKLESLDGDELMKVKDNINSLFQHCIQALGEEHQIKVVNALQTLCALFRGVHQKNKSTSGFDIINMLMGFDKAELRMKVTDNISQNTILEYVMINSIFEAILQVGSMFIADAEEKISVQTNEAILLALYEAVHLNRNFITVLAQSHPEIDLVKTPSAPVPTTPTAPLGTAPPSVDVMSSTELPLDPNLQTSNLLITFLKYSSIVMQDTKDEHRLNSAKLCLIILTCIAEDQYANAFLHDDNMNFRVNLHRMPMRHRKKGADKNIPSRPLVCAVLDLMVEFIVTHMMKEFPMDLYIRCVQVVHKLICYQKKCRVRLHYTWRELWSVLRLSTNAGQWKEAASKVTLALVNIRAIINHFNPKIESYAAVNHISQLSEEQVSVIACVVVHAFLVERSVLEVVRSNYDTLTLKLQDGLDQYERYSEQPKEAAFFKELVRSISLNVRKNVSLNTLSQDVLLKEFSSIS